MKTPIIKYAMAMLLATGFTGCSNNSFFDPIPGQQFGSKETFSSKVRTEQYLNNVYSYVHDCTDALHLDDGGGFWTEGSLEGANRWNKTYTELTAGTGNAASGAFSLPFSQYYKGIAKASTFIQNVDLCSEATTSVRKRWAYEARALRAYYYFELMRIYGPIPLIGEDPIPLNASLSELLKERNSIDEVVEFIASELDKCANSGSLPDRAGKANLGRMDVATCKALKAKLYLYWASPLFNGDADEAKLENKDGKKLFPQSYDASKWEKARDAYRDFLTFAANQGYKLTELYTNGKLDPYKSCRAVADFFTNSWDCFDELIMARLRDESDYTYWTCPKFSGFQDTDVSGGGGFYTTQETVDMFFTANGLPVDQDPTYDTFEDVPTAANFTTERKVDNLDPSLVYYDGNTSKVLKQWTNREPRFYVNVTFSGSIWFNKGKYGEEFRTDFTNGSNGTCGKSKAQGDYPISGYLVRRGAKSTDDNSSKHFSPVLRMGDMFLGYAEACCEIGDLDEALTYLNKIRHRAGIPLYSFDDAIGTIKCPKNKIDLRNRIHRERIVEMVFEWNRYYDVRRWKVAEGTNDPEHWIYPAYHKGGEGGDIHGMNTDVDYPQFFKRTAFENRTTFTKKYYFFPIPYNEIRRVPNLVQNIGW